jgi:hypothetical protein
MLQPLSRDIVSATSSRRAGRLAVTEPTIGMRLQKTGHTSGVTYGVVELIDFDSDYFGSHSDVWVDGGATDFSRAGRFRRVLLQRGARDRFKLAARDAVDLLGWLRRSRRRSPFHAIRFPGRTLSHVR